MRLKFYEVDSEYIKYLKENADKKVPNFEYKKHKKFFVECFYQLIILIILLLFLRIIKRVKQHF